MKVLRACTAACVLVLVAAVPARAGEVQGWQTDTKHIHTIWAGEQFENLAVARQMPVTTLFHHRNPGDKVTFVRWSDGSELKQSATSNFMTSASW
jgi:hypothetical protein